MYVPVLKQLLYPRRPASRKIDINSLILIQELPGKFMFLFAPSTELAGQDKFVTNSPEIMAQNIDHVPIITGLNSKEGIIKVAGKITRERRRIRVKKIVSRLRWVSMIFMVLFSLCHSI